jgi:hypothetical protein
VRAPKPDIKTLAARFEESPTVETLQKIIQECEPYCLRTRLPRYNQAAIAACIFERVRDNKKLSPTILNTALKREACWDAWNSR